MVDMNLEVHIIPVHDPDRAKQFYQRLGWRLDSDDSPADGVRLIQFTPPGSGCSVTFGTGITAAAFALGLPTVPDVADRGRARGQSPGGSASPGTFQGGLIVTDILAAHRDLTDRGIEVGEVFHGFPVPEEARMPGPHPERASRASYFPFQDSEGNAWLVQEITTRMPGRERPSSTKA